MIPLYDYQKDAINNMHNGCILNGGVGSGKSRTALAYYYTKSGGDVDSESYSYMTKPKDLYIITTAHKRDEKEWEGELAPFHISVDSDLNYYDIKVVIDSWNNIKKYENVTDAFFIFDEQRVIGSGTWTKAFLKIAKANKWVLLSATPGDTWSDYMAVFIANGFYKNKTDFINQHVIFNSYTKYRKIDRYINTGRLIYLRNHLLVDMDFDRKTNAIHEDIFATYDIAMYKRTMRERWNPFTQQPIKNASELCYTLRKIVNSDDSRQTKLLELLESIPRAIIFYNFDYELDILRSLSYGEDVEVAEWNGHCHQEIPDCEKWIYLVQYTAGAEGWNCIKTDTIIFFSQTYSYKVLAQSAGRIDRLNTPFKDLYYYHFRSRSGIDLAIYRALSNKKKFNESKFVKF